MVDKKQQQNLPDFRAIFRSSPDLYLILDNQLLIVDVSDSYARATMIKREDIIGKKIFDVFPTNHMAFFDVLTGLANREQLSKKIEEALAVAATSSKDFAIFLIDLDQFKIINDTLGHKVGDVFLQIMAKRLRELIQPTDVVARLGGDEFVMLIKDVNDTSALANFAEKVLAKIKAPVIIDEHSLYVSASVGISIYPKNGDNENTLLRHADIAMYRAKQQGGDSYQFCTLEMIQDIHRKVEIEADLRRALKGNNFTLHYQPQIDLKTGKICGVEALLRLEQEKGIFLMPTEFITIAEETGLIIPIGEWVLRTACQNYKTWEKTLFHNGNAANPIKLAVNFSARQLKEPGFLEMIYRVLQETEFPAHNLEFEVTENPIIIDVDAGAKILDRIKKMGAQIALDDFGIGYSSLNYIRQFSIDTLKIDQSLIQQTPHDSINSEMVVSIIRMAHAMNMLVVAEGVETKEQIDFLMHHQCDQVQSHFFSKPLTMEDITKLLSADPFWKISILE